MRALCGSLAALAILAFAAASADAGQSGFAQKTRSFASTQSRFGQFQSSLKANPKTVHRAFRRASPLFFNSGPVPPLSGTIVPPLRGTIVPSFAICEPIIGHRFFKRGDRFHRRDGRFHSFFATGFIGDSHRQTIIVVERYAVPVVPPPTPRPPVRAQIVDLDPSPEAGKVQIFMPGAAACGADAPG